MKKLRHPVTTESNLLFAISKMTGLSYQEMEDEEIIWFLLQGMRPIPRSLDNVMSWHCGGGCEWGSPRGKGGDRILREAVRQHLRDKHQKVRTK